MSDDDLVYKRDGIIGDLKEPYSRIANGSVILDAIEGFLRRFIAYPSDDACIAHALWIAHTHTMDEWESTPRLAFLSPEPASGKTRALEITETLVPNPVEAVNVTPAYLFRKVSDPKGSPTVLFDEIDTIFGPRAKEHEEIRGLLNAGHRRGATAGRCVVQGKIIVTEELPAYCAVALAGLGNLPGTILTRSIVVRMRRRAPGEEVDSYRRRLHADDGNRIRDDLNTWTTRTTFALLDMPDGIEDRDADVWEPLLAIADAAGGDWPQKARVAAVALVAQSKETSPSLGVRLLADCRSVFGDDDALHTSTLIERLVAMEEAPWGDLRGKAITSRTLSRYLKPYGVESKNTRIGDLVLKGYTIESFHDAWKRYLPEPLEQRPSDNATPATSATSDKCRKCDGEGCGWCCKSWSNHM